MCTWNYGHVVIHSSTTNQSKNGDTKETSGRHEETRQPTGEETKWNEEWTAIIWWDGSWPSKAHMQIQRVKRTEVYMQHSLRNINEIPG